MSEEKILEEGGEIVENQLEGKKKVTERSSSKETEASFEQSENKTQEKIKQVQDQIVSNSSTSQSTDKNIEKQAKEVTSSDKTEDQIQKLIDIAVKSNPKTALKVARALNSNYALDKMHDRLIDEEKLRAVLIQKGFIEKI